MPALKERKNSRDAFNLAFSLISFITTYDMNNHKSFLQSAVMILILMYLARCHTLVVLFMLALGNNIYLDVTLSCLRSVAHSRCLASPPDSCRALSRPDYQTERNGSRVCVFCLPPLRPPLVLLGAKHSLFSTEEARQCY